MDQRIIAKRILPDGKSALVMPYHISWEGLESALICRDEEDYDVLVKYICICARRCNVIVIIYGVVSNHAHIAVLAENKKAAEKYSYALKKVHSMWLRRKYNEINLLLGSDDEVIEIKDIGHVRNALAYIPRNALDNGAANIEDYKWTGYRAMFCNGCVNCETREVSSLSTRQVERIFHSGDNLSKTSWLINQSGELEPASTCDWSYLERIFNNTQSFFLNKIGSVNSAQMSYESSPQKSKKQTDTQFLILANEYATKWYGASLDLMTDMQKIKMLGYLNKMVNISIPQAARCLKLKRETIAKVLGRSTVFSEEKGLSAK